MHSDKAWLIECASISSVVHQCTIKITQIMHRRTVCVLKVHATNVGVFNMQSLVVCYHYDNTNDTLLNCVFLEDAHQYHNT